MFTSGKIYGSHLVVNGSVTDNQQRVQFLDNNYVTALPASATIMRVLGLGDFKLADMREAVAHVGRNSTRQVLDITAGSELSLTATPIPAGTRAYFKARIVSEKPTAEFNQYMPDKYVNVEFEVVLNTGDTNAIVLAKLYNAIKLESSRYENRFIDVNGEAPTFVNTMTIGANGLATTGTQLFLVAKSEMLSIEFDSVVYGADDEVSPYFNAFVPTIARQQYSGVNNYTWMRENVSFENEITSVPFHPYADRLPVPNTLYSDFQWKIRKDVANQYGHAIVNERHSAEAVYTLWVNETLCPTEVDNIATFLNQVVVPSAASFSAHVAGVYTNGVSLGQFITNV
jgi:hypothetical protein